LNTTSLNADPSRLLELLSEMTVELRALLT
jgi:hypothetical protein